MTNDQEFRRIQDLQWEAYRAGLYRRAAEIAHRGAEQARAAGNSYWRVRFIFWEGDSRQHAGDLEAARISLLEAARPTPESDPADSYSALVALISVAVKNDEAGYCRRLITQGRDYLVAMAKEEWRHHLDFQEGYLEYYRGEFERADHCLRKAHDVRRKHDDYPGYSRAAHLFHLVNAAFSRHDPAAVTRRQNELEECKKQSEYDKLVEQVGHLLLLRARRGNDSLAFDETAPPAALELLRRRQAVDDPDNSENRVALRALALALHWPALDDWLERLRWNETDFHDQLFLGDERLCRARHALGLPARDDEWDEEFETPPPGALNQEEARDFLTQARARYDGIHPKAEAEDRRLETAWYTDTLDQRLARVAALEQALD